MRVGDLRRLELGWFDWRAKTLALTQHKTGLPLTLPLPGDVGWAVIDYIRHGRPEGGLPRRCSSSTATRSRRSARRRRRAAGSAITRGAPGSCSRRGRSHGLHSLRGALAVAMLQADTPPPVVTAVLGHAAARTTAAHYLRLDTEHLRRCALDVEDVLDRRARSTFVSAATLPGLIDTLVAARHAGGFRYDFPERVLRQFAEHCRREGYADGSIIQGSRRGVPLRPPPQGVHHPPRGDHPARPGRTRPPVRLAGVGAADADSA